MGSRSDASTTWEAEAMLAQRGKPKRCEHNVGSRSDAGTTWEAKEMRTQRGKHKNHNDTVPRTVLTVTVIGLLWSRIKEDKFAGQSALAALPA